MWLLLCIAVLAAPPDRVERLLKRGDVARAERVAERWVARTTTADSLLLRASVREAAGQLEESVADRIAALQLAPERAGTVAARTAELLVVLGRLEEAQDWARRAVADDATAPPDTRSANRLMLLALDPAAAASLYDEAVSLAVSADQRARALVVRAEFRQSAADAQQALDIAAPDSRSAADALQILAEHAFRDGELERAEALQERAVTALAFRLLPSDPALTSALESWATIAETDARHSDAIARLQTALSVSTGGERTGTLHLALARNVAASGRADLAADHYRRSIDAAVAAGDLATSASARNALGIYRYALGDLDEARDLFVAALADIARVPNLPAAATASVQDNLSAVESAISAPVAEPLPPRRVAPDRAIP